MQDCDYSIIYSYFFICATAKFIADDKVVYQQVRWVTRLASDTAVHSVVWSISAGYRCELSCVQL